MEEENDVDGTSLPIFKKGHEIADLVRRICDLIPDDNVELQMIKGQMLAERLSLNAYFRYRHSLCRTG